MKKKAFAGMDLVQLNRCGLPLRMSIRKVKNMVNRLRLKFIKLLMESLSIL